MKLQINVLYIGSIALCIGALLFIYRRRPTMQFTPHGPAIPLLDRIYRLCLVSVLSGALISLSIALLRGSIADTTIGYSLMYAFGKAGDDSWEPMKKAIEHIRRHPDIAVYQQLFFKDGIKFQYPPSALLFLDIPQRLTRASWESLFRAINLLCWFCVPAIGLVCCTLLTRTALSLGKHQDSSLHALTYAKLAIASIVIVMAFYPITLSFVAGQVQTPMTLLIGLALIAWQRRRFGLAGFLIGLCCGIKPQWVAIIPWAIIRRQWRLATALSITAGALISLSVLMYGLGNHFDYVSVVSYLGKHGESYHPNQSVNGLVNRLLFNGNNLNWIEAFAPFHPVVYAFTLVSSLLILGGAMFWRMNKEPSSVDMALIMLSLTMASPIAWEHHYGILLPIFAILIPAAVSQCSLGKWTMAYLWLALLLTSQKLEAITYRFASTHWNFLQSYLFVGAVMVLALLYRSSYLQQRRHSERTPTLPSG